MLTRLSEKVTFAPESMSTLVTLVAQSRSKANLESARLENDEAMLTTLAILFDTQRPLEFIPQNALSALATVP